MPFAVYIDSCAWDFFFAKAVDLAVELPHPEFKLFIVNETAIELQAIPDVGKDGKSNLALKQYIASSLDRANVGVQAVFGFLTVEPDGSPSPVQVYAGFDHGIFAEEIDNQRYAQVLERYVVHRRKRLSSPLSQNQADAAVALRSFDAVVVTAERKTKSGPLKGALAHGGKIAYLGDWNSRLVSLRQFIQDSGDVPHRTDGT